MWPELDSLIKDDEGKALIKVLRVNVVIGNAAAPSAASVGAATDVSTVSTTPANRPTTNTSYSSRSSTAAAMDTGCYQDDDGDSDGGGGKNNTPIAGNNNGDSAASISGTGGSSSSTGRLVGLEVPASVIGAVCDYLKAKPKGTFASPFGA